MNWIRFRFNVVKVFLSGALVWIFSSTSWDVLPKSTWLPLLRNSGFLVLNPPCSFHVYKQRVEIKKERKKIWDGQTSYGEQTPRVPLLERKKVSVFIWNSSFLYFTIFYPLRHLFNIRVIRTGVRLRRHDLTVRSSSLKTVSKSTIYWKHLSINYDNIFAENPTGLSI